jgi:hypothetical protein
MELCQEISVTKLLHWNDQYIDSSNVNQNKQ